MKTKNIFKNGDVVLVQIPELEEGEKVGIVLKQTTGGFCFVGFPDGSAYWFSPWRLSLTQSKATKFLKGLTSFSLFLLWACCIAFGILFGIRWFNSNVNQDLVNMVIFFVLSHPILSDMLNKTKV